MSIVCFCSDSIGQVNCAGCGGLGEAEKTATDSQADSQAHHRLWRMKRMTTAYKCSLLYIIVVIFCIPYHAIWKYFHYCSFHSKKWNLFIL